MKPSNVWIVFGSNTFCARNDFSRVAFALAFGIKKADYCRMTTVTKLATVAMSIAICASAFAAPNKTETVATSKKPLKAIRCTVMITGSAVRQDCSRLSVIPTTPYQLDRVGGHSATND